MIEKVFSSRKVHWGLVQLLGALQPPLSHNCKRRSLQSTHPAESLSVKPTNHFAMFHSNYSAKYAFLQGNKPVRQTVQLQLQI